MARKKAKNIPLRTLLILIILFIVYCGVVWFFPVADITPDRSIDKFLEDMSIVLGIDRHTIIEYSYEEDKLYPIIIDDTEESEKINPYYRIYFSKVFDGNLQKARNYKYSIDRILSKYIKNAEKQIHMAMYDINSEIITNALIYAFNNGIEVRIVSEMDYMERKSIQKLINSNIPIAFDARDTYMHNKFLIIDNKYVWTGSYNTTDNGAYKNNNNAIVFSSKKLAKYYNDEFKEMFYLNKFSTASPDDDEPLSEIIIEMKTSIDEKTKDKNIKEKIKIQAFFIPDIDATKYILDEIRKSRKNIYFMAFSFTKDAISQALIEKHNQGIPVAGIFEGNRVKYSYSEYTRLKNAGVQVMEDKNKYNNHHKVIIIDEETLITGSANFSNNGMERNDENLLIIKNKDIANAYIKEYYRMKEAKSIPQE